MSLADFAHWHQNSRRVDRNSSERLSTQKQRTLLVSLFDWNSQWCQCQLKKAATENKCQRADLDKTEPATPTSLHTISRGHQQGIEEHWEFPQALERVIEGGCDLRRNVLSYPGSQRQRESGTKAVGRPKPGFHTGVAESQRENSTGRKPKWWRSQKKSSRHWLC